MRGWCHHQDRHRRSPSGRHGSHAANRSHRVCSHLLRTLSLACARLWRTFDKSQLATNPLPGQRQPRIDTLPRCIRNRSARRHAIATPHPQDTTANRRWPQEAKPIPRLTASSEDLFSAARLMMSLPYPKRQSRAERASSFHGHPWVLRR